MFEQSVLPAAQTNTRAAFVAVTAAELLGVAAAVVIPLFLIGRPSVPKLPVVMRFQPRHVELVAVNPEPTAVQAPIRRVLDLQRLVAPVGVPTRVIDLHDIAAAAVAAVEQWVYKPTLLNGEAVEVIAPITVNFTLSQ
jgi:hypothetical protein